MFLYSIHYLYAVLLYKGDENIFLYYHLYILQNIHFFVLSVLHIRGAIVDFVFGGYIEKNNFYMEDFKIKANGTEKASGKLALK